LIEPVAAARALISAKMVVPGTPSAVSSPAPAAARRHGPDLIIEANLEVEPS